MIEIDKDATSCSEAEPFALQVLGNSMEPEFKEGVIIIIDPEGIAQDGSYVMAVHKDEYIFRQLKIRDKQLFLSALNSDYPEITLQGGMSSIKGVIVQQAGKRRKDRKFYDR